METDKNVIWVESPEEIKDRLTENINSVHSDFHGIVILNKGRIESCNNPVREFFNIARKTEITGLDISLLIPPHLLDSKMLNPFECPGMYSKKGTFTDYMGMQSDIWMIAFDVTSGNYIYKVIVFQNLVLKSTYSQYYSQMLQNLLTNVHSFISEIQLLQNEKQMIARMLDHIAIISRANLLFFSSATSDRKVVITHFKNNDPKLLKSSPLFESLLGLQMAPSEEAKGIFRTGKVHESPLDINTLTFNSLDPIQIEKISNALSLAKVYSIAVMHQQELHGIFTMIYNQQPEFFYHSAIELYIQSIAPLIATARSKKRCTAESDMVKVTGNALLPVALVNEREVILNCNDRFISFLNYKDRNELIGKSTREISDRVEFDNYLTNIYMRKKKISGIYQSVLIDKNKKTVPVTIFAGPFFENEKFSGAFGLFVRNDSNPAGIPQNKILPDTFPLPYAVCDLKGKVLESNLLQEYPELKNISDWMADISAAGPNHCEEMHTEMQRESLYLTLLTTHGSGRFLVFRLYDTRKDLFIYLKEPEASENTIKKEAFPQPSGEKKGKTTSYEKNIPNDSFPRLLSEIRSPFNHLLGLCHLASEELNSSVKNKYISQIFQHASYINKLFEEILEIQKIESGATPLSVSDVSVNQILSAAHDKIKELLKREKNSRLMIDHPEGVSLPVNTISSDESRILLIFELISSILIQSRKNGKVTLGYREVKRKENHCFNISFTQEIQVSAFQPIHSNTHFIFDKLDVIGEIHYRLAKLSIELLGGIYTLHNGYDYQEFSFSLPAIAITNKPGLFSTRHFTFSGQTILIMSGESIVEKTFAEISAESDLTFDFVNDGLHALNAAKKKKYDAIILDLSDENPDGLETMWAFRHKKNDTPLLAIIEQDNSEVKEKCIKMGCQNFLGKPLNNQIIIHKLHRILTPEK